MPYRTNADLPESVKNVLPAHAQDIYRDAFNHAWDEYADPAKRRSNASHEETARRVAWGAMVRCPLTSMVPCQFTSSVSVASWLGVLTMDSAPFGPPASHAQPLPNTAMAAALTERAWTRATLTTRLARPASNA